MKLISHYLFTLILIIWNIFQNNDFIYQRDNQKVMLQIEKGMKYFKWNEKTKLTIKTENIDGRSFSVSAPGLKLIKGSNELNNESIWEITPNKKYIKNDTLKLQFRTRDLKDVYWTHKFEILIK